MATNEASSDDFEYGHIIFERNRGVETPESGDGVHNKYTKETKEDLKIGDNDSIRRNSGKGINYKSWSWTQTEGEIKIRVKFIDGIKSEGVDVYLRKVTQNDLNDKKIVGERRVTQNDLNDKKIVGERRVTQNDLNDKNIIGERRYLEIFPKINELNGILIEPVITDKLKSSWTIRNGKHHLVLKMKKKTDAWWKGLFLHDKFINEETMNMIERPVYQYIRIPGKHGETTADALTETLLNEESCPFEDFPRPICVLTIPSDIDVTDNAFQESISMITNTTEGIIILTDILHDGVREILGDRNNVRVLSLTREENMRQDVLNNMSRWFIFVDEEVEDFRTKFEKSLSKKICVFSVVPNYKAFSGNHIPHVPAVLLPITGTLTKTLAEQEEKEEVISSNEDIEKQKALEKKRLLIMIKNEKKKMDWRILRDQNASRLCDLVINVNFFMRAETEDSLSKSQETEDSLSKSQKTEDSFSKSHIKRAEFILDAMFDGTIRDLITYLTRELGLRYSLPHDFASLRSTLYILHYAVYKTLIEKGESITRLNLQKSLKEIKNKSQKSCLDTCSCLIHASCGSLFSKNKFKEEKLKENESVYEKLFELTEGVFVRKEPEKFGYYDMLQELFIWALVCNLQKEAVVLCQASKDILASCLIAHRVLINTSRKIGDKQTRLSYIENAGKFAEFPVKIVQAYKRKPGEQEEKNTENGKPIREILPQKLKQWNGNTYIQLGRENENKRFIAEGTCQEILNSDWMGKLSYENSTFKCVICILFPLLILVLPEFKDTENKDENGGDSESNKNTFLKVLVIQFKKLYRFYTAPFIVHINYVIAYLVFLLLFTYFITVEFGAKVTVIEILIISWVGSFFADEIRQLVLTRAPTKRTKILYYWSDGWNKMDIVTICLFTCGLFCRIVAVGNAFEAARIFYAISLMGFYLRILHLLSTHEILGPRLLMIYGMLKELVVFLVILVVFVIGYSVASYSVAYPNSKFDWLLPWNILRLGFWNLFGEFFLEEFEIEEPACSFNETVSRLQMIPRCPTEITKYYGPILLVLYFMVTNVLLLNLLIAVFNKAIEDVSAESEEIWKLQRSKLIAEYCQKPALVPPFILISHVKMLIERPLKTFLKRGKYKNDDGPDEDNQEESWSKCLESFEIHFELKQEEDLMSMVKNLEKKLDEREKKLDEREKKHDEREKKHDEREKRFDELGKKLEAFFENFNK